MRFVGIDLAERFSAAVVIDSDCDVLYEAVLDTGPKQDPPNPFEKNRILLPWWLSLMAASYEEDESYMALEDVHPHAIDAKPALKLQGAVINLVVLQGTECHIIRSLDWQQSFGYNKKVHGDTKKWAKTYAEECGYEAPKELHGKKTTAKQRTDLVDAFLIAVYLRNLILC